VYECFSKIRTSLLNYVLTQEVIISAALGLVLEEVDRFHHAEHETAKLWQHTLAHVPSAYGKLVYLASLRNADTGKYEHFRVPSDSNGADTNRALRASHESIFQEWVSYSLQEKKTDLELYISGIEQVDRADLIDAWLRLTPYKNLVPAAIQGPERQKHISDFEAILGLLKNVYGVASPDPIS